MGKLTDLPHGFVAALVITSAIGCGLDDIPELEPEAAVQAPEIPPPEDPQLRAPGPDLDPMARCAVARERPTEALVADRARNAIVAVDLTNDRVLGDLVTSDAGGIASHDQIDRPVDATLLPDGSLVVANFGPGSVLHFDGETGEYLDTLFYDTRILEEPTAVRWTGEHLLVLGNDSGNLLVLDESGTTTSTMGDPGCASPSTSRWVPSPARCSSPARATPRSTRRCSCGTTSPASASPGSRIPIRPALRSASWSTATMRCCSPIPPA